MKTQKTEIKKIDLLTFAIAIGFFLGMLFLVQNYALCNSVLPIL